MMLTESLQPNDANLTILKLTEIKNTLTIGAVIIHTRDETFRKIQENFLKNLGRGCHPSPLICHTMRSRCTLMMGGVALATLPFSL
jgi:hypothetical protein